MKYIVTLICLQIVEPLLGYHLAELIAGTKVELQ